MVPTPKTAIIVGAGIGGLATALSLRRAGWRASVFERADSARELGFALVLAPNAMHALRVISLANVAREGGVVATDGEMRRPDGTVLRRFNTAAVRAQLGEDTVCILRPVLHGALLDAVGLDSVSLGSAVTAFEASADGVEVTLANGRTASGHILIGADGVGSLVRRRLHPVEGPPRPSGLIAIRGVARGVEEQLAGVSGAQYFGRGFEAGVARAGARDVYWFLSLRADECPPEPRDVVGLSSQFAARFHEPFRTVVRATTRDDLRLDDLFVRAPIDVWGAGRVTLLGDAAHPMLPHAGQGAAQALEDAVALAQALSRDVAPADALRRYERVRSVRTRAIVQLAQRNARVGSIRSAAGCGLRDLAIRLVPASVILKSLVALGRPPEP